MRYANTPPRKTWVPASSRTVQFSCPFCKNQHSTRAYVDGEGNPHVEDKNCGECGAYFRFDFAPAKVQMRTLGFSTSEVKDVEPPVILQNQCLIAQKFKPQKS